APPEPGASHRAGTPVGKPAGCGGSAECRTGARAGRPGRTAEDAPELLDAAQQGLETRAPSQGGSQTRPPVRPSGHESAAGGAGLGSALSADALYELRTGPGGRPAGAGRHEP